jgi:exodeoxyribonuclease VII large subunit
MGNAMGYAFKVDLFEAVMQGDQAERSIVKALKNVGSAHDQYDLVVLIRGGGAQLDLDCFDNYSLALEITRCPLPVVTGIGHQRDDTVADMVAHTKMKTPTAVAEFLLNGMEAFEQQLNYQADQIKQLAMEKLSDQRNRLFGLMKNLDHGARLTLSGKKHKLALLNQQLSSNAIGVLKTNQQKLSHFQAQLGKSPYDIIAGERQKLQLLEAKISLADPVNILNRGYSITYLNGKVLTPDTEVNIGDRINTRLSSKTITSNVTEIGDE